MMALCTCDLLSAIQNNIEKLLIKKQQQQQQKKERERERALTSHASHDTADRVSDSVQVGDSRWIQKFVGHFLLSDNYGALFATHAH